MIIDTPSLRNNFNLLRILAALQVVYVHTMEHLNISNVFLNSIHDYFLKFFPGVPIFFFLSGFLIYWSFDRNHDKIKKYILNRLLRIYPALWSCLIFTVVLLLFTFPSVQQLIDSESFYLWFMGQLSIFQFYTPDILRTWGVGTPNGSLWTIIVELQFYFVVPFIHLLSKNRSWIIWLFIFLSIVSNIVLGALDESIVIKLLKISILPYFYYFGFGILFLRNWRVLRKLITGSFLIYFFSFLSFSWFFNFVLSINTYCYWIQNPWKIVADIILCFTVFSFGYSLPRFNEVFKDNDISYGTYIYHMLVVNLFVQYEVTESYWFMLAIFGITILLASLSWKFIERPALRFKKIIK